MRDDFPAPQWPRKLDPGEREAIALAIHVAADFVILDDLAGRTTAVELGLSAVGSFGLLVRAKRHGLLASVRPAMDAMISHGLYASEDLYQRILFIAGERE